MSVLAVAAAEALSSIRPADGIALTLMAVVSSLFTVEMITEVAVARMFVTK